MPETFTPLALVADDDAIIRMNAVDMLETAGFKAYEASNVAEALVILAEAGDSIQLLFTDVQMPPGEEDGFYLARECAARWPHIGILVASGLVRPAKNDMPDGAIFIGKPLSAEVVFDRMHQLLPEEWRPEALKRSTAGRRRM